METIINNIIKILSMEDTYWSFKPTNLRKLPLNTGLYFEVNSFEYKGEVSMICDNDAIEYCVIFKDKDSDEYNVRFDEGTNKVMAFLKDVLKKCLQF